MGVLNIVTGVFVENANRITQSDEDHVIMEELDNRRKWLEDVKSLFMAANSDGTGQLSWQKFKHHVEDVRVQAYFRKLGVDVESRSAHGLFQLLDFDGDGKVDVDEFAMGIQEIHGTAAKMDIARLRHDIKDIGAQVRKLAAGNNGAKRSEALTSSVRFMGDSWQVEGLH